MHLGTAGGGVVRPIVVLDTNSVHVEWAMVVIKMTWPLMTVPLLVPGRRPG